MCLEKLPNTSRLELFLSCCNDPLEFATNSIHDYMGQRTLPEAEGPKQRLWVGLLAFFVWVVRFFK